MATKAEPGRKSSSKTSAARKRAPSKPVIIDIEADAAAASDKQAAAAPQSSGLDEATARTAGLSASGPAPTREQAGTSSATVDPGASASAESTEGPGGSGPKPFILAAAGFIGAMAALVLLFLAQLLGFVSVPNGQLDEQRSALLTLEDRVGVRLTALEAVQPVQNTIDLGPLEADLAQLREELASLRAEPVGDGAPADVSALIAQALAPLEERIGTMEAVIQLPVLPQSLENAPENGAENGPAVTVDRDALADLRDVSDAAAREIAALQSDLGSIQADLAAVLAAPDPNMEQIAVLEEQLSLLSTDTASRLDDLSTRVVQLGEGMAVIGDQLTAFEQAPIAVAPDQLARLGLALSGLASARDTGVGLGDAVLAAQTAAAFDAGLSAVLSPLSSFGEAVDLHHAGLLQQYESASAAMLAAAAGSAQESAGLLDALGERARQMVSIRAPGDTADTTPGTVTGQIEQIGGLLASGQYEAGLNAFESLPEAVKTAGTDLLSALHARVTLDTALAQARSGLMAALASSNQ